MGGGHKYRSSKLVIEVGSVPLSPGGGGGLHYILAVSHRTEQIVGQLVSTQRG